MFLTNIMEFFMIAPVNSIKLPPDNRKEVEFIREQDLAQYKGSDYSNAVRVERGITLAQAKEIAANDPEIDYFVYLKGGRMVLEFPPGVQFPENGDPLGLVQGGCYRIFHHGDVVFFKNEGRWLGTAPGLADVYSKKQ